MANQNRVGTVATSVSGTMPGQTLRVQYHQTVVVSRDAEGTITLDSGGWRTATTKTRMNQAANQFGLGFQVYAKRGEWFVSYRGEDIPFRDGMTL